MVKVGLLSIVFLTMCCGVLYVNANAHCQSKTTWHSCPRGTMTCKCPGTKKDATFDISCKKKNTIKTRCGTPSGHFDCSRYALCDSCKSVVGNSDLNVCTSCLDKGYTGARCNDDVDECATKNGGCDQVCKNSIGSYSCDCNAGYSLKSDKHGCARKSCGKPEEPDGMNMVSHPIPGAADYEYETSVEYSCSRLHHVLVGNPKKMCDLISGSKNVEWESHMPDCVVECSASEEHDQCGVSGVDPVVCDQLGCCYNEDFGTCHMKPGHIYLQYEAVRPKPSSGFKSSSTQNVNDCKELCELDDDCESFAVVQSENELECFRYRHGRDEYIHLGLVKDDGNATYFDPITFDEDIDWKEERATVQHHFEHGCYDIKTTEEYLPLVALSEHKLLTGMECADTCQALGYHYSGVKVDQCRCGKTVISDEFFWDDYDDDDDDNNMANATMKNLCTLNCTGDLNQICGGEEMYTVQRVPEDPRYLGCYDDNLYPIPIRRWEVDAKRTVEDCIEECTDIGFNYAAVQNGGACLCGNQYPQGADVPILSCNVPCVADKGYRWCGGIIYNSVYRASAAHDLTGASVSHYTQNLYHRQVTLENLDTMVLTAFPKLRNFVTKKLALSSSVQFLTPQEDTFCSSGDCYSPCLSLDMGVNVEEDKGDVTIRQFFVKFSDLEKHLENLEDVKHVTVYAQSVYVDVSIDVDYALVIRSRQIFINRETSIFIRSLKAPDIEGDWDSLILNGPDPDLYFSRISYTCVRLLTSTTKQKYINVAYSIVNDLSKTPSKNAEQEAIKRSARGLRARMAGIDFTKTNHVPLYNKDHIVKILETYYDQLSIYKTDYDRMHDSATTYEDFLKFARNMNEIHQSTIVNEALVSLKNIEEKYAEITQYQIEIEQNYNESLVRVEEARDKAFQEIENIFEGEKKAAKKSFLRGVGGVIKGALTMNFKVIAGSVVDAYKDTKKSIKGLEATFERLSAMVDQINTIIEDSKALFSGDNDVIKEKEGQLMIDAEVMVSMSVNIIKWRVMKDDADLVIDDIDLQSAGIFRQAMSEYTI